MKNVIEGLPQKEVKSQIRVEVILDAELDRRLRRVAFKYNATKSDVIRYALNRVLPELEKRLTEEND